MPDYKGMPPATYPEELDNPRPKPRYLDPVGTGNFAQDGFMRIARRPRSPLTDEMVPVDQADRIEAFDRQMERLMGDVDSDD